MGINESKVYVLSDNQNRITRCDGGYTTPADLAGWVQIDEGTGDRYNLCQSHYFDGGLYTDDGIPRYKLVDGQPVERTNEEIDSDRIPILEAQIRAQRNKLLLETDWTQIQDNQLSQSERESWATYRQQLRDIPEQAGFPKSVEWPELGR